MIKLYDMKLSPNCRRVRMFLAEKGVVVPMEECFDPERACLRDDYVARYPFRLVPMLELDDGTQIGESTAICRYLEALYPQPNLLGQNAVEQANVEMWQQRIQADGELGAEEMFRNAFPPFKDRGLAGFPTPVPQIAALVERGRVRFGRFLQMLDRQLSARPFVAGARFSIADISALCAIDFGKQVGHAIPDELAALHRWYIEVSGRPSAGA